MHLCYLDESGTPDIPGTTSHYVLIGICIPIDKWKFCDSEISKIKTKYDVKVSDEIHTAWILKPFKEQKETADFEKLSPSDRRAAVRVLRGARLSKLKGNVSYSEFNKRKKDYRITDPYIHLTHQERKKFIYEIASCVSYWNFVRLFGECVDKNHFSPRPSNPLVEVQALEQVVTRFQSFLAKRKEYGLIIHDNNDTVKIRHTELMRNFHKSGTLWSSINNIVETPFFVDSQLTVMVQIADLCSYAIRRYLENKEKELFDIIHPLTDQFDGRHVGLRHFTKSFPKCPCVICGLH